MNELTLTDGQGRTVLCQKSVEVGRDPANDLILPCRTVSRRHCVIVRHGNRWLACDLASTNGTRVNGTRVSEMQLEDGDRLRLGANEFVVGLVARSRTFTI
jgi:pSer/pThr/pTyr-binding forkhead associated (FHA) protein